MGIDVETCVFAQPEIYISIHAPRMGIDRFGRRHRPVGGHFNPRSPDGERRPMPADKDRKALFQSTPPGWGATSRFPHRWPATRNFNPRPPDGERQRDGSRVQLAVPISIHAPRMGSDTACHAVRLRPGLFQSTLPGWGATLSKLGMRPTLAFQSTLPVWGATCSGRRSCPGRAISIHAPRMGSDSGFGFVSLSYALFQSTLPGWGATRVERVFVQ